MDIFQGVLSVTSGPVAIGLTGMNLLVAGGNFKRDYKLYTDAMDVILYNRSFIKEKSPMLYNVVMVELLFGHLEKTLTGQAKEALLKAVPGQKVAGKLVGIFIGKMGEDRFKLRLNSVNKLFKDVLIKVADHAAKNWPEKLGNDQIQKLATHHVLPVLRANNLINYMDQDTAEKIVSETAENCLGLQGPLKKISAALDKM